MKTSAAASLSALPVLLLAGCAGGSSSSPPGLVLSKSIFGAGSTTMPSTMEILTPPTSGDGPWTSVVVSDDETREVLAEYDDKEVFPKGGNVFHKVMWFEPVDGDPGLLSISANAAWIKMWRPKGDTWAPETLWNGVVGGKENRLRDVEVGDVDGDGQDELVVVTHDHGVTYVFEQTGGGLEPKEVGRAESRTFIHEVEIGDIDGDGVAEFMTTPSEPNKFEAGAEQSGQVSLFQYEGGEYVESIVEKFPTRHAKEILCADLDRSGTPELYVALEANAGHDMNGGGGDETLEIHRYEWDAGQGKMVGELAIALPGAMCRFLNAGDTNGDGKLEIIASTHKQGIFTIWSEGGAWKHSVVAAPYLSGGFEHATYVMDFDGDGRDDVIAASDKHKCLQRFYYQPDYANYEFEELMSWAGSGPYFTWNVMPIPAR